LYPGSLHVRDAGLSRADDQTIWEFAAQHDFTIVTKDDDFRRRSFVFGPPPKVIWVRLGNCHTKNIEHVLRARHDDARAFLANHGAALRVLSLDRA
jgi:predicted nuclease of predicted toxin-antitoxin system